METREVTITFTGQHGSGKSLMLQLLEKALIEAEHTIISRDQVQHVMVAKLKMIATQPRRTT